MITEEHKRICACGKEYSKPETCSKKQWAERYKFCSISCAKKGNKNRLGVSYPAWNKGIPSPFIGELSATWKGEKVGYSGVHKWVSKWKGSPKLCEKCGRTDLSSRSYHWANVDHQYHRVLDDYIRMCVDCHIEYDKERKLRS